ncbi:hypothetical protein OUZ56_028435 [Daphnia magna]|uniref:tRNA (guanine(9)-N(1))-methyltransferase n=1 Tax=Daphnia magna TaxID=35525 RepID=A0ABR0B3V8_9CRUS|nr:hypothetical protein OUZ56_028435 [Daphnia magna]
MSSPCTQSKGEEEKKSDSVQIDPGAGYKYGVLVSEDTPVNRNDAHSSQLKIDFSAEKENDKNHVSTLEKVSQNESYAELPVQSKSALKRKMKKDLWELRKKEKRIQEREKRKKRKLDPTHRLNTVTRKQLKNATMANSNCKVTIAIDLSFDNYMDERSLAKCVKQISRCYSINRRATDPVQFHVTSLDGASLKEMSKNSGYENWDVNLHEKHFTEIFSKEKIVYLTSESDNVIENLKDDYVYIIGGLVDHNSHKGLCHKLAEEKGLSHGRLPISENIDMKTRKVLTIDHVFNVMVNICNGQSWKEALLEILPARKGAQEKPVDDNTITNGDRIADKFAVADEDAEADEDAGVDEDASSSVEENSKMKFLKAKPTSA